MMQINFSWLTIRQCLAHDVNEKKHLCLIILFKKLYLLLFFLFVVAEVVYFVFAL